MRNLIVLSLSAALLAGCGSNSSSEMEAGKWEMTMTIDSFEVPEAPEEMQGMMAAMAGQSQTQETCVTEEQAAKGWAGNREQLVADAQGCEADEFTAEDGTITARLTCKGDTPGANMTMAMDGTYTPGTVDMTVQSNITDEQLPGGEGTMKMSLSGKRVGECDADTANS